MSLTYRTTTADDLISNFPSLQSSYGSDPRVLEHLPRLWQELFRDGLVIGATIEDRTRPIGARIVALGASVFITDEFLEETKTTLPPCIGGQIASRILEGRSPILSHQAIQRANAQEGLNLCILHDRYIDFPPAVLPSHAQKEKLVESFFILHRGYQLKEYLQELYGETFYHWAFTSGLRLRTDYTDYYERSGLPIPSSDSRPYLMGISRQEVLEMDGSRAFQMFVYVAPRFHFTSPERLMLQHALAGETDDEIARSVFASLSTIKKRWTAVYERVEAIDCDLLNNCGDTVPDGKRGTERRRHLVSYLRDHPEELLIIGGGKG